MANDVNATVVNLEGRIDSNNANEVEKDILTKLEQKDNSAVIISAKNLEYISSAGRKHTNDHEAP